MTERLREVAEQLAAARLDLLGVQPEIVGARGDAVEQRGGVGPPALPVSTARAISPTAV